jgi:hypothetical protein
VIRGIRGKRGKSNKEYEGCLGCKEWLILVECGEIKGKREEN